MRTTSLSTQATQTVSQGQSRYGTAEPQIEIRLPKGTSHRLVSATLHQRAAEVELATPGRRIVLTKSFYDARSRVYFDLAASTISISTAVARRLYEQLNRRPRRRSERTRR
ncbi:hypothetical protein WME94_09230 [Sorangium sp. So ce429]